MGVKSYTMKLTSSYIIGLDVATKCGVAVVNFSCKKITTLVYNGTPAMQLQSLLDLIGEDWDNVLVKIESLQTFRNAVTTRSLLTRTGYLAYSLEKLGATIEYVSPSQARKNLGVKTKDEAHKLFAHVEGITNDETDAIAVALFGLTSNVEGWTVERIL